MWVPVQQLGSKCCLAYPWCSSSQSVTMNPKTQNREEWACSCEPMAVTTLFGLGRASCLAYQPE